MLTGLDKILNKWLCLLQLVEVVMDLGRAPLARFPGSGDVVLSSEIISHGDLEYAVSQVR